MTVLGEYEDFYARPDGVPIYAIRDNLSANKTRSSASGRRNTR
ncbi:MAG: hypothetical protein WB800_31540 [Streptosporangiaceae bacterium]|jgi:hypothetical protein